MCKSHKFLMISNCDFLSTDIVLSKSALGVWAVPAAVWSVDRLRVRLQMSISRLSLALGPVSLSLSLFSVLSFSLSLYSARAGNVARSRPPQKLEKAREGLRQSHLAVMSNMTWSDRMRSWDDFVTVARAGGSATSHNKNIVYASSWSESGAATSQAIVGITL